MDVRLYWSGDFPEYLEPLLGALEQLPETEDAPDGEVVFCPDASAFAPPAEPADAYVAALPNTGSLYNQARDVLASSLAPWAERGALFIVPTSSAAANLRVLLGLPADRVRVVSLPLPPSRVPRAATPGTDVLAVPPINYPVLMQAVKLVRLAGLDPRLVLADPAAEPVVRPGGLANSHGLLAHREVVAVDDWHEAAATAGTIVLFEPHPGSGWTLREALATGVPVVTPQSSLTGDHLAAVGAGAYPYAGPHDVAGLAAAIASALRRERGTQLENSAREAVLAESWADSASALYGVLMESLHPTQPPAEPAPIQAAVTGDRLTVCVLNPKSSEGGGERFMRELVLAMALHESRPRVKLVCQIKPFDPFDPGTALLQRAGVEVVTVPGSDFDQVATREMEGADIVYYSWPHMSFPLVTKAPLVCTFHDLNWKHFDVYSPQDKVQLEAQTPRWIELCSAMVHSSNFIRGEMRQYYGTPDSLSHVIPLTAETPAEAASPEERAAVRRRWGLPERFLLSPNGCHLHKNYPVLDAALRILRRQGRPISVVASGGGTDIRYHGPDLIGLGYVSARELQALYEESDGMVQTTLYEAGSFPMWEAMTAHKPVAISRVPPIVEQVERLGATVELFDPLDPEDVAAALARIWDGSPATSPEALERNAAATAARSWNDVAADYLALFAELRRTHGAQAA